jgi:KDO2-lipid IV(A) lauroyltransferase
LLEKPVIPPRRPENRKQRWGIIAAWLFANFTRLVPLTIGYWLADRAGDIAYWRTRVYRLNVIDNLRHVYRGQISDLALRRPARVAFRTSARNFWDLGRAPHMEVADFDAMVQLPGHGWDLLDRIQDEGKGGIILTAHFGAFDFVGQMLYIRGYHPYTMTAPTVGEFVYAAVSWLRLSKGATIEDISPAAIRRMLRVLLRGGFAGFVADRDFTDMGAPVELFGEQTTLPTGPVKVARLTGAPIIPVFVVRDDVRGRTEQYAFHIADPFYVERTSDEDADIDAGMRKMASALEQYISMHPEQWVMFQRVWPEPSHVRRHLFRKPLDRPTGNVPPDEPPAVVLNEGPAAPRDAPVVDEAIGNRQ